VALPLAIALAVYLVAVRAIRIIRGMGPRPQRNKIRRHRVGLK
jgi:hypothetical protein